MPPKTANAFRGGEALVHVQEGEEICNEGQAKGNGRGESVWDVLVNGLESLCK